MGGIREWIAGGKVTRMFGTRRRATDNSTPGSWQPHTTCNALQERQVGDQDREEWYELNPGCRGGYRASEGLEYSPSLGSFVGTPGAVGVGETFLPAPPPPPPVAPIPIPQPSFASLSLADPVDDQLREPGAKLMGGFSLQSFLGGAGAGTTFGGPVGGLLGGVTSLFGGQSKCKGPYDYVNGQCVPKTPGVLGAVQRALPGGASGYSVQPGDPTGTSMTIYDPSHPMGGAQPGSPPVASAVRRCPRGPMGERMVLAKDGTCWPKSMLPRSMRANPYHKPAVSWGDQKAIRRAASAQKRLIRLTKAAGGYASSSKPRSRSCK